MDAIGTHVASMDPEMVGMHRAVRRIHGEIKSLNGRIDELSEQMAGVGDCGYAARAPHRGRQPRDATAAPRAGATAEKRCKLG